MNIKFLRMGLKRNVEALLKKKVFNSNLTAHKDGFDTTFTYSP